MQFLIELLARNDMPLLKAALKDQNVRRSFHKPVTSERQEELFTTLVPLWRSPSFSISDLKATCRPLYKNPPKKPELTTSDVLLFFACDDTFAEVIEERLDRVFAQLSPRQVIALFWLASKTVGDWLIKNLERLLESSVGLPLLSVLYLENAHRTSQTWALVRSKAPALLERPENAARADVRTLLESILERGALVAPARNITNPKPGSRLRVAVSISGQLRGFKRAFETWSQLFTQELEVEYFVSTWRCIGKKFPIPKHAVRCFPRRFAAEYEKSASELGEEVFQRKYPNLMAYFERTNEVTEQELSELYRTDQVIVEDDREPRFAEFSNPRKMYYQIDKGFRQVVESGREFDLIVRIRPDKVVQQADVNWPKLLQRSEQENAVFGDFGRHARRRGADVIGDQFAVGVPKAMSVYSNAYASQLTHGNLGLALWPGEYTPHVTLGVNTFYAGISVKTIPGCRFNAPAEAELLTNRLLCELLEGDAQGRMDDTDRRLLAAAYEIG